MKYQRTCRCGKVFWASYPSKKEIKTGKKEDPLKDVLCQECRNERTPGYRRPKSETLSLLDSYLQDIAFLKFLEKNVPDDVERLRRKPLNSKKPLDKKGA
jgi:hypothetical protein